MTDLWLKVILINPRVSLQDILSRANLKVSLWYCMTLVGFDRLVALLLQEKKKKKISCVTA